MWQLRARDDQRQRPNDYGNRNDDDTVGGNVIAAEHCSGDDLDRHGPAVDLSVG